MTNAIAAPAPLHGAMDRVRQQLTRRVKEQAERDATRLPQVAARVAALQTQVDRHRQKTGFANGGRGSHPLPRWPVR